MKRIRTQFLAALVLSGMSTLFAFTGDQAPADFSGKWVLDIASSNFGNFPPPQPSNSFMRILQQDPSLIMESNKIDSLGKATVRLDTVFFDGQIRNIARPDGSVIKRSSVREWSADGQVMRIASKFSIDLNGQAQELSGTESWSLSDGGNTLTMVMESVLPDRTEKATKVYKKIQ